MDKPTIAIVGGGFSGLATAVQLLRHAQIPVDVTIFDRAAKLGPGVAYGTAVPGHLLNVPAARMSALPDIPDHFHKWVTDHQHSLRHWLTAAGYPPAIEAGAFLPRAVYGAYLKSLLATAAEQAPHGSLLVRESVDVVGIDVEKGRPRLSLASGERLSVDIVVLAIGNLPPSDPPVSDPSFYETGLYRDRPWDPRALEGLKPDDSVMLIGTGLTMIDLATTLIDRGHWGKIYAVSRRGLLPHHHASYPAGLYSLDVSGIPKDVVGLVRWFRNECMRAEEAGSDWRAVFDAFRPHTQSTWAALSLGDKRRFLRHARGFWEICRHRVPPRILDKLAEARSSGQFQVTAGRIREYEWAGETVNVSVSSARGTGIRTFAVQRVINCTGPSSNFRKMADPQLSELFKRGLAAPDALHLGLETDDAGRLLGIDGKPCPWLYTLGPTRKGNLWETTAVPEIRVQAQNLARAILEALAN